MKKKIRKILMETTDQGKAKLMKIHQVKSIKKIKTGIKSKLKVKKTMRIQLKSVL